MRDGSDAGKSRTRERVGCGKESDARRVWKGKFFEMFVFLTLAQKSAERKGDLRGREWTYVVISERIGGLSCFVYSSILLSFTFS